MGSAKCVVNGYKVIGNRMIIIIIIIPFLRLSGFRCNVPNSVQLHIYIYVNSVQLDIKN